MSKRYKHIPTGKIAIANFMNLEGKDVVHCYMQGEPIDYEIITKGKDWEEVKDKPEWTILSIKNKIGDKIRQIKNTDQPYDRVPSDYNIYSVRRLSDGVEFKIGDKIKIKGNRGGLHSRDEISTITAFENDAVKFEALLGIGIHTIDSWIKVEKLFITEDGVDIYEGDKYWINDGWYRTIQKDTLRKYLPPNASDKAFSTKEAAEEYILMNKPCLSLDDVINKCGGGTNFEDELLKLVKSKL